MINGMINVYKERGFTSFDVCAVMRGIAGQKKVGHTGTLDPDAEGVLPVCLGNATKLCDMLTDKKKEYIATFLLGKRTDTLDIWGTVLEERTPHVTKEELTEAILSFKGGYDQLPPMFSAKKVNGQKLVDIARKGREVERKPVHVDIDEIEILSMDYPNVEVRVLCGKGTYIRSLCEDIAGKCGEIACMTSLKRTRVSEFRIEDSYRLDELKALKEEGRLMEAVRPTDVAFTDLRSLKILTEFEKYLDNGNKLLTSMTDCSFELKDDETVKIYDFMGFFTGLYKYSAEEEILVPYKMFFGEK